MPRVPGQNRQPDMGNRTEVRVRGNAHQLLEKYKQLARDASQAGDRVAAEYYLQHADHYFRTLSEFRARQEEQRIRSGGAPQRDDDYDQDDFDAPEPLRVAEMTPMGNHPQAEPDTSDDDGDDDDGSDQDGSDRNGSDRNGSDRGNSDRNASDRGSQQAEPEAVEAAEERPRRRRRSRSRREDGDAAPEMATVDA